MKLNKIFIISLIYITVTYAQFTEVFVNVEYSNISAKELFFLENLEQEIESYFINNYFFDASDDLNMMLDINMIIENVNTRGGEKIITAQILFSNKKDNHFFSKSFDFTYQKNEALYKSEMFHPLASLLNYYAYLHIAYELDGYQYLGGNQYFIKAQNIASDGKGSLYPKNWQSRLKKLRREQENYTYRDLKYNFFTAYDILEKDITNTKEGEKFYQNFYNAIIEYDGYYGYSKPLTHFLSAYNQEIVRIAQILDYEKIIDFLLLFDSDNQNIYQQYYEN